MPTPKLTDGQADAVNELILGLKKKPITAEDDFYDDYDLDEKGTTEYKDFIQSKEVGRYNCESPYSVS